MVSINSNQQGGAAVPGGRKADNRSVMTAKEVLSVPSFGGVSGPCEDIPDGFSRLAAARSEVIPGSLFFAERPLSPEMVEELLARGAVAFVAAEGVVGAAGQALPTMIHSKPMEGLVELLRRKRSAHPARVVNITGSVGKTTTKLMLECVAASKWQTFGSPENRNLYPHVRRHLQHLDPSCEVFIQETGAYRPGAVADGVRILRPDAFVITGIGFNHVGDYGDDWDALLSDKLSCDLYAAPDAVGFVNLDDPIMAETEFTHPIRWYSVDNPDADFYATSVTEREGKLAFEVVEKSSGEMTPVALHTHGIHNVSNALAAFAVGRWLGLEGDTIARALTEYRAVGTRQNLTRLGSNLVLVDSYNASEVSIASTSDSLLALPLEADGRRILVLGDIDDKLGNRTEEIHRRVGKRIGNEPGLDLTVLFGEHMRFAAEEASSLGAKVFHTTNRQDLNNYLRSEVHSSDVLAFKGGQHMSMAATVDAVFSSHFVLSDRNELARRSKTVTADGGTYRIIRGYGAALRRSDRDAIEWNVSSEVQGEPVLMLGNLCFTGSRIQQVTIPEPVQTIGRRAFFRCKDLEEISLPPTLRFVGEDAFRGCTSLRSLTLPVGLVDLRDRAFSGCRALQEVILPPTVAYVGENVFANCPKLTLKVPAGSKTEETLRLRGATAFETY